MADLWLKVIFGLVRSGLVPAPAMRPALRYVSHKMEQRGLKHSLFRSFLATNGIGMFFGPILLMEETSPFIPGGIDSMITTWLDTWGQLRDEVVSAFNHAQEGTVAAEARFRLLAMMDTYDLALQELVQADIPEDQKFLKIKDANYSLMRAATREFNQWIAEQGSAIGFRTERYEKNAARRAQSIWREKQTEFSSMIGSQVFH